MTIVKVLLSSILAGMLIGIGGIVYLTIEGTLGAAMFSVGLLSILHLRVHLFTGNAGKLATKSISVPYLFLILLGNFCGTFLMAMLVRYSTQVPILVESIVISRDAMEIPKALLMGVGCGILMFIATSNASTTLTVLCVTAFIVCGFTHCIADSFYYALAAKVPEPAPFICTIVGNLIGCNIAPLVLRVKNSGFHRFIDSVK